MFFGKKCFSALRQTDGRRNRLPRTFQILFVCNHLRNLPFPASGNPSARFADANTNDGKRSLPRRFQMLFDCNHLRNLPCGKLTNDGKPRLPRGLQKLFVCNHLRNLPFPACGSPSARFADAEIIRTTATSCHVRSKYFLFVIICGICRFPQAGIPRQDSLTRIRTTANVVCRVDSA